MLTETIKGDESILDSSFLSKVKNKKNNVDFRILRSFGGFFGLLESDVIYYLVL